MAEEKRNQKSAGTDAAENAAEKQLETVAKKKVVKRKAVSKKTAKKKASAKKAIPRKKPVAAKEPEQKIVTTTDATLLSSSTPGAPLQAGQGSMAGFWAKVAVALLIAVGVFLYIRAQVHQSRVADVPMEQQFHGEPGAARLSPATEPGAVDHTDQSAETSSAEQGDTRPDAPTDAPVVQPASVTAEQSESTDGTDGTGFSPPPEKEGEAGEGQGESNLEFSGQPVQELVIEATKLETMEAIRQGAGDGSAALPESSEKEQDGNAAASAVDGARTPEEKGRTTATTLKAGEVSENPPAPEAFRELFGYRRPAPVPGASGREAAAEYYSRPRFRRPELLQRPFRTPGIGSYPYYHPDGGDRFDSDSARPIRSPFPRQPGWAGHPPYPYAGYPEPGYDPPYTPPQLVPGVSPYLPPTYEYR